MKHISVVFAWWVSFIFSASAQSPSEKPKLLNHYIGIQVNELIKQVINLNTNQAPFTYPYLITYSVSSAKYGWAINAGAGYSYQRFLDKNTPANHETKINNLFYRAGIGRKFTISKKISAGAGLDYIAEYKLNKTVASTVTNFGNETDSSSTNSITKEKGSGYGAQVTVEFHISEKVLLGTESTFYFMKSNQKQNVMVAETITDNFTGEISSRSLSATNLETEKSDFTITVPVSVFLIVKF